jgi:hypothetical protein
VAQSLGHFSTVTRSGSFGLTMARIALAESASASFVSRYGGLLLRAAYGQGHIEHDWRVCWPMKDRYAGDPAEGAALDHAYGRPVQAAWLFSAAQNGGRYLRRAHQYPGEADATRWDDEPRDHGPS